MRKLNKGITLIALIITIVVLLILAVVAIRAVTGDGILQYAMNSVDKYEREKKTEEGILGSYLGYLEEEQYEFAVHSGVIPDGGTYITLGGPEYKAGENFPKTVMCGDSYVYGDYIYSIEVAETIDEAKEATRRAIKEETGMSFEDYLLSMSIDEETFWSNPEILEGIEITKHYWRVRVKEDNVNKKEYGEILGKINGVLLTSMDHTFESCTSLTTSPTIPSSVTNMSGTFVRCSSLTTAPTIPSSVTSMEFTFSGCSSLTTAPAIPSSVTNMSGTFNDCSSLTTAPTIPSSVTNMVSTFVRCSSLTTAPAIPSSVTNMDSTFSGCSSLTTAPAIPSSVTNMNGTFWGCNLLSGNIEINVSNLIDYSLCFHNTVKDITLTGSASNEIKFALASTANYGNVKY